MGAMAAAFGSAGGSGAAHTAPPPLRQPRDRSRRVLRYYPQADEGRLRQALAERRRARHESI